MALVVAGDQRLGEMEERERERRGVSTSGHAPGARPWGDRRPSH